MRIGIDCRAYGSSHGYMGKYIEHLVSYLEKNEDANEYVLFFSDRGMEEFLPKSVRFRTARTPIKSGNIAEQIFFPYEIHREKLDIMLFSHPNIPLFYFGKSILILSDLVSYFYPEKRLKNSWMRHWQNLILGESMRKSRSIIVLSEVLKRDIIEIFDIHEEKIRIIPPMCFDIKSWAENEAKQFLSKECISEKYILCVGELREYKNIPRLLQAYHLLLKENEFSETSQKRSNLNKKWAPQWDVRSSTTNEEAEFWVQKTSFSDVSMDLVLVGKEDPTYHEIRSTLIQLGLQSRVHIYNVLDEDEIGFLYQNASLYILPSLYEGSEEALLTPLAYGLPLASSSLPSITTVLGKENVAFFRPMSVPEIQEALRKSLSIPLRTQSKKDISTYSIPSVSSKIRDVFSLFQEEKSNL